MLTLAASSTTNSRRSTAILLSKLNLARLHHRSLSSKPPATPVLYAASHIYTPKRYTKANNSTAVCHFNQYHTNLPISTRFSKVQLQTHYSKEILSLQTRFLSEMADARFCVEYAKTGRSSCKKCKQQIEKGVARIGKITSNPFSDDGGEMKVWYHVKCIFETFKRARATTKKVESPADLEGFPEMNDSEKDEIKRYIKEFVEAKSSPKKASASSKAKKKESTVQSLLPGASPVKKAAAKSPSKAAAPVGGDSPMTSSSLVSKSSSSKDDLFSQFRRLCESLEKEPSYNAKTKLVGNFIKHGSNGDGYTGDVYLLVKLLLPTAGKKRVYNLQSKQIVKLLSQIFGCSVDNMVEDLEKGDVAETAKTFFEQSEDTPPAKSSTLTLAEVDSFLDRMTQVTKEDDQRAELSKIVRRCTSEDLKYIIRLIKHDLRTNSGPKHILDALNPNAYAAFQASHDLQDVIDRVYSHASDGGATPGLKRNLSVRATLMTPVKPMLAEACRAVATAIKKCPNGMYAEIKYDGERVQVHKQGDRFEYFSRSLKPVQPHKVEHIKSYLPKACPHGDSMILDCEVLMVDTKTGKPLPFGTLGIHKKSAFKDACCCLFIFDIIYFNGETLLDRPLDERRKILEQNITEVKNRIMLSEQTLIRREEDLSDLIMKVIRQGLEGLVLKDTKSIYEPGKRHWLKVKKDYLQEGAMADTADLIVLGAYYGTGNKGGMMSVFLMGVYDKSIDKFRTVAKCGNGHDDATIARLQKELDMVKISKDVSKVPKWLLVNKSLLPDFVIRDPKKAPVWEITGAEFSSSNIHTADGISIRFPRVTKIRDDKTFSTATDLERLKLLFKTSKETVDIPGLMTSKDKGEDEEEDMDTTEGDDNGENGTSSAAAYKSPLGKKRKAKDTSDDLEDCKPPPTKKTASPSKTASPNKKTASPSKTASPCKKGSPSKKKPVCKYGPKCYQTSTKHKEQFDHPWDTLGTVECAGIKIEKPLPDLFSGVKVFILPGTAKASELKRYLIAYDGEVVEEYQRSTATHFIADISPSEDSMPSGGSVKCVKADWIWDSLKQQKQLSVDDYTLS